MRGCGGTSDGSPSQSNTSAASISRSARPTPIALHGIFSIPEPCRVGQAHRRPAKRKRDLDIVSRGARDVGDDCPILANYSIDKARFSSIRRTSDNHQNTVFQSLRPRTAQP